MNAFVITEPGRCEFREVPEPRVGPEDVLLRVEVVGLCGTDLSTWRGKNPLVTYPRIPGHEISATIEAVGPDVPDTIREGMRATISPCTSCGECAACRKGRGNACRNLLVFGVQREGALTDYVTAHHTRVRTSDTLSLEALAFAEPMTIGYHAVQRGRVTADDTVAVLGCGGIGTGVVTAAVAQAARVIAVDLQPDKVDLMRSIGAAEGIEVHDEDVLARIDALTDGRGADVVLEAAGVPETFVQAVDAACYCGRVVFVGYCKAPVTFDTARIVRKELDVLGTRNAFAEDFAPVVDLLEAGRFPVEAMITRTFDFADCAKALQFWGAQPEAVRKLQIRMAT